MDEQSTRSALQAEYLHIQGVIEGFDGRILSIKTWSITFSLVALGGAFASHSAVALLIASISSVLFWYLEAIWKTFQVAYYERAELIEAHFRGEVPTIPFQIGGSWYASWKAGGQTKLLRVLLWPHVAMPHAAIAFAGVVLFILSLLGHLQV
jgi:uncharacterized membrane protein